MQPDTQQVSTPAETRASNTRDDFIDELRGIALIGIALVNAQAFAFASGFYSRDTYTSEISEATVFVLLSLVMGKFFLLFSFLFGFSSSFILGPNRSDEVEGSRRFKRRLFALGLIGCAHGVLLFFGDILAVYACLGFSLLWLNKRSTTSALKIAFTFFGFTALVNCGLALLSPTQPPGIDTEFLKLFESIGTLNWLATITPRAILWSGGLFTGLFLYSGSIVLMFSLGLLAARNQWLSIETMNYPYWQLIGKFLWIIPLLISLIYAYESVQLGYDQALMTRSTALWAVMHSVSAPLLTLAYIAWARRLRTLNETVFAWIRPLGAMSLTTYLSQSILFAAYFSGWGFGYFNRLTAFELLGLSLVVIAINIATSIVWMGRFKQGPVEKLVTQFSKRISKEA